MQCCESGSDSVDDGRPPALFAAIAGYASALHALGGAGSTDDPARTLCVLRARDEVAGELLRTTKITVDALQQVVALDSDLRSRATAIAARVGRKLLIDWRSAKQPPDTAWWWTLDAIADRGVPAPHPLWTVLAAAFITLAISLTADISLRLLSGGPDLLGLLSTFSQAALAVLAGGAFTRVGGEWIDRQLVSLNIARGAHGAWKAMFAVAVFATILGLRLSLPWVAQRYSDLGVGQQQAGRITEARQSFERAVRLNPDDAAAHFNLASAYEDTLDYDAALGEYQRAIKLDERLYPAHNNLARLLLLRKSDAGSALGLLDRALALKPEQTQVQYTLLKNRGWANLNLGNLLQADNDLQAAIALRPQAGAAAHCLLAQLLEEQKKNAGAEWQFCVSYAAVEPGEAEANWVGRARERLLQEMQ